MAEENQKPSLSSTDVMEKYKDYPGSTPREKLRNAHARLRELQENKGATRASTGPSESSHLPSSIEAPQTLVGGIEKADVHPEQLRPPVEPSAHQVEVSHPELDEHPVQTIEPSVLAVHDAEPRAGSVQLGPSEFAISLPMDSRVKDDYEQILRHEARRIRDFLNGFSHDANITETEVRQHCVLLLFC